MPLGEPAGVVAELRRGVLAAVHARDEGPARVVVLPLGEVVDFAADDDPAVVERRVLCELLARDGPVAGPWLRRLQRLVATSLRALLSASLRERKCHGPSFLIGSLSPISRASNA